MVSTGSNLGMSRPMGWACCGKISPEISPFSGFCKSRNKSEMCGNMVKLNWENSKNEHNEQRRSAVVVQAKGGSSTCVVITEPKVDKRLDLALLMVNISGLMSHWFKGIMFYGLRKWNIQMSIEKAIVDCRFFTLPAIAGSLIGSVLCFVEGCFLILRSFVQYFLRHSHISGQGHTIQHLIEAIDMFLVGTAMLIFGMGLHVMFVGSNKLEGIKSNLYTILDLKKISCSMGMQSVMQAKSKMGHAVLMILQVELLEKFKSIPLVTPLDLACFAAAVFLSSASVFVLSRLAVAPAEPQIR